MGGETYSFATPKIKKLAKEEEKKKERKKVMSYRWQVLPLVGNDAIKSYPRISKGLNFRWRRL